MTHTPGLPTGYQGYNKGCRCDDCRADKTAIGAHRRRQIAYGTWGGLVPAGPAQTHLAALRAAGMTWGDISEWAGLTGKADSWNLLHRRTYLRAATQERILAIPVPASVDEFLPIEIQAQDLPTVDGIRLLRGDGWVDSDIARVLGKSIHAVTKQANRYHIPTMYDPKVGAA